MEGEFVLLLIRSGIVVLKRPEVFKRLGLRQQTDPQVDWIAVREVRSFSITSFGSG